MFARLMPTEGRFFELFEEHAEAILQASHELASLMVAFDDVQRRCYNIETIEKRGDRIAQSAIELLHKTFITPIDRDDIHHLVTRMDDILDMTEDAAQSIYLYDIRAVTLDAKRLADICVSCAEQVKQAASLLSHMENGGKILAICAEIDKLESEADHVMGSAMAKPFRDEPDVRQVTKLRAIYELLEGVTDRCDDVANIIEGIVLDNSWPSAPLSPSQKQKRRFMTFQVVVFLVLLALAFEFMSGFHDAANSIATISSGPGF